MERGLRWGWKRVGKWARRELRDLKGNSPEKRGAGGAERKARRETGESRRSVWGGREPESRAAELRGQGTHSEGRRTEEGEEGSKKKKVGEGEEPGSRAREQKGTKLAREVPAEREFRAQCPGPPSSRPPGSDAPARGAAGSWHRGGQGSQSAPGGGAGQESFRAGQESFPAAEAVPRRPSAPAAAAAPHLPELRRRGRAAAATAEAAEPAVATEGGAAGTSGPGPRPCARGPRHPLAAAPRDRVRLGLSAPSSGVWKLFSQGPGAAWPRGGPAAGEGL